MDMHDVKDGAPVWYHPVIGRQERFAAVVDGEPWLLGGHTPVVHLRNLEAAYSEKRGRQVTRVAAASLQAIAPREASRG